MKASKPIKMTRRRAVEIAANHNAVSMATAERYTDSELIEVLRHLRIKAIIV